MPDRTSNIDIQKNKWLLKTTKSNNFKDSDFDISDSDEDVDMSVIDDGSPGSAIFSTDDETSDDKILDDKRSDDKISDDETSDDESNIDTSNSAILRKVNTYYNNNNNYYNNYNNDIHHHTHYPTEINYTYTNNWLIYINILVILFNIMILYVFVAEDIRNNWVAIYDNINSSYCMVTAGLRDTLKDMKLLSYPNVV